MRVVLVGPFPWPSHQGSQAYVAGQAKALARAGHDVRLVVYAGEGGELPGVELVRGRRVPFGRFEAGGLHVSRPLHDLALASALRRTLRDRPADVIHAHNVEGPLIAALARTGLPVVYHLHTEMADELATHLPVGLRWAGRPAGRTLDRLAMAASHAGAALSPRGREVLASAGLPVRDVVPWLDPSELVARPDARERHGPGPWVVYTGNLDPYQDVDLLVDAMRHVPARLLIVTGSDDPLPSHVHVVRSRHFQDALDALSVADVAVIPRRTCAGFPIKLLNHVGMGVPTVMIDSAAIALPGVVACPAHALASTLTALVHPRRPEAG